MTKDEARQKCKTDAMYLGKVLGYDFQPDVHPAMFEVLRKDPKHYWRLILWPRGHFKTTAVTVDIVQNILNNPNTRLLLMQATLKLTKAWVREVRSHFNGRNPNSRLLELFPEFKIVVGESDAEGFTVGARTRMELRQRTVTAASPKAAGTGSHFDDGYFDDLVNQNNYKNVEVQDQLESDFALYQPLIDPGGFTTVTGTRYSFADLYQRIISRNKGEWNVSVRKAYNPDGSLLFPARDIKDKSKPNGVRSIGITAELLAQKQKDDPETFAAQYLNEILLGKQQIFPESLILGAVRSTKDKEYPATAPCYFFVDLAEGKKATSDNSVIVIGRQDALGRIWIVDCLGHTWSVGQLTNILLQQAVLHRPSRIWIEKQPGAEFFAEHARVMAQERGLRVVIDTEPGSRQKDAKYIRISALENFFRQKKIFLCAGIHDFARLTEEFTQFPRGRHDDRPDAVGLLAGKLAAQHFPTTPKLQPTTPWFVTEVLKAELADAAPKRSTSLCGDGFI